MYTLLDVAALLAALAVGLLVPDRLAARLITVVGIPVIIGVLLLIPGDADEPLKRSLITVVMGSVLVFEVKRWLVHKRDRSRGGDKGASPTA